jgi:hypothetical protein
MTTHPATTAHPVPTLPPRPEANPPEHAANAALAPSSRRNDEPPGFDLGLRTRLARYRRDLRPSNQLEDDLVVAMARHSHRQALLDQIGEEVRRRAIERALQRFSIDRALEAAEHAARLSRDPERVLPRLRSSVAGLILLRDRWRALAGGLRDGVCAWTDAEIDLALDLVGIARPLRAFHPDARRLRTLVETASDRTSLDRASALGRLRHRVAYELGEIRFWIDEAAAYEEETYQAIGRGALVETDPAVERLYRREVEAHRGFDRAYRALGALRGGSPYAPPESTAHRALSTPAPTPVPHTATPPEPASAPSSPTPLPFSATGSARVRFASLDEMALDPRGIVILMSTIKTLEKARGGPVSDAQIEDFLHETGHLAPTPTPPPAEDDGTDA